MENIHSLSAMGVNNVPAFLTKIWTLVEDPNTDEYIAWDTSGMSFHIYDQTRFSKEILPLYFKHNNIASFIRQLNMYGFRKVVHVESGILKNEVDDVEFHHPYFIRGQEDLLENIKRKPSGGTGMNVKTEPGLKLNSDDVSRVLNDVQVMKNKQDSFTSKMDKMKKENEALWREVATLRQKHMKQQQIVNKLIQFMIHLVGGNRGLSTGLQKRKLPLMINDSSQVSPPKRSRHNKALSIGELQDYVVNTPSNVDTSSMMAEGGPVIHDITDIMASVNAQSARQSSSGNMSKVGRMAAAGYTALNKNPAKISQPSVSDTISVPSPSSSRLDDLKSITDGTVDILGSSLDSNDLNSLVDSNFLQVDVPNTTSITSPSILSDSATSNLLDKYMRENPIPARIGSATSITLPNELSGHLDTMQDEIDNLKDLLSGGQYNFDPSTLVNLFNSEQHGINLEDLLSDIDSQPSLSIPTPTTADLDPNTITGNELVQFLPQENLLPICPDLSECISDDEDKNNTFPVVSLDDSTLTTPTPYLDLPVSPTVTEIDPMSFINTIPKQDGQSET